MTAKGDRRFADFKFLVGFGTATSDGPQAGFHECSEIGSEATVPEHHSGTGEDREPPKVTGRSNRVTLRHGVAVSASVYGWLSDSRGSVENRLRTVTIRLHSEAHERTVHTWKLVRARITNYVAGPTDASGTHVAVEELTLECERIETEL